MGKENLINTNLSLQLEKLIKKLELNQEIINSDETINETKTIDGEFFYNSWKKSFYTVKFKLSTKFTNYIKKDKIISLPNMGYYLKKLLDDFFIDIYDDDPNQLEKIFDKNK